MGNWTKMDFLELWIKSDAQGSLFIAVLDTSGNGINWDGRFDEDYRISDNEIGKWSYHVLRLDKPTTGYTNFSSIETIIVGLIKIEESGPVTLRVGGIRVSVAELVENEHIHYVKTIGKLDFYQLDDQYFLDKIYATNKFEIAANTAEMLRMMDSESFTPGNTIIFLRSQSNINDVNLLKNLTTNSVLYKPSLSFKKLNPTRYEVNIVNASQPFFLVFGDTYHPLWEANIGGERIPDRYHFIVNGYANAWYVDKAGTYKITLIFSLQDLFEKSIMISVVTFVVCILYLNLNPIKRYMKRLGLRSLT
jgi:hypothetical protein